MGALSGDPLGPSETGSPRRRRQHQDYSRRAVALRLLVACVLLVVTVTAGVALLGKWSAPSNATPSASPQVPAGSPVIVSWAEFSTHAQDFLFHHVDIPEARQVLSDDRTAAETTELVKIEISIDEENQASLGGELAWLTGHLPQACFDANYMDYKSAITELKQASDLHLAWARKYPNGDPTDLSRADTLLGSAWNDIQGANLAAPLADPHQPCASS